MTSKFQQTLAAVALMSLMGTPGALRAQTSRNVYKMQPVSIHTRWAKDVSPANALKEYPRPQMQRENWTNLNGLWEYAITLKDVNTPESFEGNILVPYPLESALSGVKKSLSAGQNLWYKRKISFAPKSGTRTLLHFGAVDFEATVFVNGKEVGKHTGGYTSFSFDITSALKQGANELLVKVFDPTDKGIGPHGKQVMNPANIYYTPSSGIWQTVWMETVPESHIDGLVMTPDIDKGVLNLLVKGSKGEFTAVVTGESAERSSGQHRSVIKVQGDVGVSIAIPIKNVKLWSPGSPFLYDLEVKVGNDVVRSYFGMRKISVGKDEKGVDRILLNNKPYFNLGTLDQGFWPEGLYTAPTDEALAFDIKGIKAMGFNTIRKHIKIEPARWYYYADKIGMLVWQDFVNPNQGLPEGSKEAFEKQGAEMLSQLHNYPSIVTWVLFNEKWGQYDQERLTGWVKKTDPSRIVNGHSGEILYVNNQLRSPSPNAYVAADMTDIHSYPNPMNAEKQAGKARVVGEFGGIGVFIPHHQWNTANAWGYINEKPAALKGKYTRMCDSLVVLHGEGLSASIYTQPFDVEGEQNGLMTYDREVVKVPFAQLRKIHTALNQDLQVPETSLRYASLSDVETIPAQAGKVTAKDADLTDPAILLMTRLREKPDRSLQVQLMNMVFADVIQSYVPTPQAKPDWAEIEGKVKQYGSAGEEIFLRAKAIHTINQQDWAAFVPTAKVYLEKYGAYLPENEKMMLQKAIDEHK